MPRDYYVLLGVSKKADTKTIKKAFRRLARKYHPDVSTVPDAEEKFKEINQAYEVLSNDEKRKRYDRYGPNLGPSKRKPYYEPEPPKKTQTKTDYSQKRAPKKIRKPGRVEFTGNTMKTEVRHITIKTQTTTVGPVRYEYKPSWLKTAAVASKIGQPLRVSVYIDFEHLYEVSGNAKDTAKILVETDSTIYVVTIEANSTKVVRSFNKQYQSFKKASYRTVAKVSKYTPDLKALVLRLLLALKPVVLSVRNWVLVYLTIMLFACGSVIITVVNDVSYRIEEHNRIQQLEADFAHQLEQSLPVGFGTQMTFDQTQSYRIDLNRKPLVVTQVAEDTTMLQVSFDSINAIQLPKWILNQTPLTDQSQLLIAQAGIVEEGVFAALPGNLTMVVTSTKPDGSHGVFCMGAQACLATLATRFNQLVEPAHLVLVAGFPDETVESLMLPIVLERQSNFTSYGCDVRFLSQDKLYAGTSSGVIEELSVFAFAQDGGLLHEHTSVIPEDHLREVSQVLEDIPSATRTLVGLASTSSGGSCIAELIVDQTDEGTS